MLQLEAETHLLHPGNQQPKGCLLSLSRGLLKRLQHLITGVHEGEQSFSRMDLIEIFNNTALVQYLSGRLDRAEGVCRHCIALCAQADQRNGKSDWASFAIQPYINMARLVAMTSNYERGVNMMRRVFRCAIGEEPLDDSGLYIDASEPNRRESAEGSIGVVGRTVFQRDSIRAYLQARDYQGLLLFLNDIEPLKQNFGSCWNPYIHDEARIRAFAGLRRYDDALAALRELCARLAIEHVVSPSVYTLAANIYGNTGRYAEARKTTDWCSRYFSRCYEDLPASVLKSHTALLLALMFIGTSQYHEAYLAVKDALATAATIEHEPGRLKSLALLVALTPFTQNSESWALQLRDLIDKTYYSYERAIALCAVGECEGGREDLLRQAATTLSRIGTLHTERCKTLIAEYQSKHDVALSLDHPDIYKLYSHVMGLTMNDLIKVTE